MVKLKFIINLRMKLLEGKFVLAIFMARVKKFIPKTIRLKISQSLIRIKALRFYLKED